MGLFDGDWGKLYQMGYDATEGLTPDEWLARRAASAVNLGLGSLGGLPSTGLPALPGDPLHAPPVSRFSPAVIAANGQKAVENEQASGGGLLKGMTTGSASGGGGATAPTTATNPAAAIQAATAPPAAGAGLMGGLASSGDAAARLARLSAEIDALQNPYDTNSDAFKHMLQASDDRATLAYNQALAARALQGAGGLMGGLGMGGAAADNLRAGYLQAHMQGQDNLYQDAYKGADNFNRWKTEQKRGLLSDSYNIDQAIENRRRYDQEWINSQQQQSNQQLSSLLGNVASLGVMGASLYAGHPEIGLAAAPAAGAAVSGLTAPRIAPSAGLSAYAPSTLPTYSPMATPSTAGQGLYGQARSAITGQPNAAPRLGYSSILPSASRLPTLGFPKYKMGG